MAEEYTQVVGTVPDTKAYSKTRRDERFVLIEQKNLEIASQDEYIVLDELEAGTLQSIKVTTDNPYVQVLLQVDEFRNKDPNGQCAAEIIYNGNSDNPNRSFKVIDGMSSSKGYTLEYKPDFPEEYSKRIRLVIRNSIKPSTSVYGMGLNYNSAGNLPTPAVPAHMAGGTFSHPALETLSLAQISKAMTKPVGVEGYSSNNVYNESAIMNDDIELGSDHPYEGIAGKPTFVRDTSSIAFMEIGVINPNSGSGGGNSVQAASGGLGAYVAQIIDEPEAFPGTSASPSQMKVRFTPFSEEYVGCGAADDPAGFFNPPWWKRSTIRRTDLMAAGPFGDTWPGTSTYTPFTGGTALDGTVVPASESIIGKRMFLRRGGTVYFPGVVKSVTKSIAPMGMFNDDNVDEVQGFGRELDHNNADILDTPTNFFPIGVHELSTGGVDNVVVMPFLNIAARRDDTTLEGVVIGSTENKAFQLEGGGSATNYQQVQVTLTTLGANNILEPISDSSGGYNVVMTAHTPWQYTFTFEPGTKETPIDYPLLYVNEADRDLTIVASCGMAPLRDSDGTVFSTDDLDLGKGLFPASEINSWGTVTSQADDNPKVLIKSIEVKRNKRVSYEG